jgi:hypothetical protein
MAEAQIMAVTIEHLSEMLQSAGYRAERREDPNGIPIIASATGGIAFNIRLGNRAAPPAEGFLDFTYLTVIKIEGNFPLERINEWNQTKRFARLHRAGEFIVLDMDVIAVAGVTERHLRGGLELWDRLLQELMSWLRGEVPAGAANAA